ncbi:hypothetical protein Ait01nite_044520 [Actinoplanes italicus]|nr:hypothetical protein Ait01nite_044520 [Actinoplanes italicus]
MVTHGSPAGTDHHAVERGMWAGDIVEANDSKRQVETNEQHAAMTSANRPAATSANRSAMTSANRTPRRG